MLHDLFTRQWITLHGALVVLGLGIYMAGSHTLKQRRHPSAAIAWTISLVLLPYIALPLYLMFGRRKLASTRRTVHPPSPPVASAQEHLATALGLAASTSFTSLVVHQDGREALRRLQSLIAGARHRLDICTFILGRDVLGDAITAQLMLRAHQGLKIRLLLDGIGLYLGGHPNLRRLRAAGIQVTLFVPPLSSPLRGRTNLRNHRKMAVADGAWLWCGGRNLAAEYFEGDTVSVLKKPVWIDLSFDLHGDLAGQAQQRFDQDWTFATTGKAASAAPWAAPLASPGPPPGQRGRLVPSGPDQADDTFYTLLVSGCFTAQTRILAVTPYFVPDQTLLMALTLAARRGVAVDLVLPAQSNHRMADIARHAALRELVAAGAHIWLLPSMVHAKVVLIDHDLALVGSANLDERSLFLNYELMVAFYDPPVVQQFADWITPLQHRAQPYQPQPPSLRRELVEGLVRWVAFQL
nr:phospholipase D-like domain-containing protein [uncultured Albidiferax sp.]